ncbi:MAG: metal-dependent transcriptional regulator [Oscillospiraceae bacterium]
MNLYESGENYLETILLLGKNAGAVRSVEIAERLGVTKASVSRAMGILRREGYITMPKNGAITLTEKGTARAAEIYERHRLITEFLSGVLGVDAETAEQDACRIEHIISASTVEAIRRSCANAQK